MDKKIKDMLGQKEISVNAFDLFEHMIDFCKMTAALKKEKQNTALIEKNLEFTRSCLASAFIKNSIKGKMKDNIHDYYEGFLFLTDITSEYGSKSDVVRLLETSDYGLEYYRRAKSECVEQD